MVFWISIFGMICWGIAPIFAKIGLNSINPMLGLIVRTMFAGTLITGWMVISGSFYQIKNISFFAFVMIAIEALLATLVGDLAYYAAIKKGDVSVVTIIMSSSPIVTMICAALFLGDPITISKILGLVCVIIGIILVM